MNKQIEVLHKIFELELSPPFQLKQDYEYLNSDNIINKHSDKIGVFDRRRRQIGFDYQKNRSILTKIKQVFNVDTLSNSDIALISKHLEKWLRGNIDKTFNHVILFNV